MSRFSFLIFVHFAITVGVYGANILCVFPTPLFSHQSFFQTIWRELSLRGHSVTVITPNPLGDSSLTNLTEVDIGFSHHLAFEVNDMARILSKERNLIVLLYHLYRTALNVTAEQLRYPDVQRVMNSGQTFDLVLIETSSQAWYGLSYKFKCPLVGISSLGLTISLQNNIGNPTHAYLYPDFNLPFGDDLTLFETTASMLFSLITTTIDKYFLLNMHHTLSKKYIAADVPHPSEFEKNMSLVFANSIPGFSKNRPNVPAVIPLNGLHLRPEEKLPKVKYW